MEVRLAVIDQFTEQVLACHSSRDQTKKIVTAGLTGYENMKLAAEKSGSGIHKGAAESAVERRRKKLVGKSSWFKGSKKPVRRKAGDVGDKPLTPVSVLFVPQTPQPLPRSSHSRRSGSLSCPRRRPRWSKGWAAQSNSF